MRTNVNAKGETFWTITAPEEFGSVEVTAICRRDGIEFGGELVPWSQITRARDHAVAELPYLISTPTQAEG